MKIDLQTKITEVETRVEAQPGQMTTMENMLQDTRNILEDAKDAAQKAADKLAATMDKLVAANEARSGVQKVKDELPEEKASREFEKKNHSDLLDKFVKYTLVTFDWLKNRPENLLVKFSLL